MKRFLTLLLGIFTIAFVAIGVTQHQMIRDQYIARTHTLQPKSAEVAQKLALTDRGELLFRASRSEIQDKDNFNQSCQGVHAELTIVLGCYTGQRIFVYNVTDKRLAGAVEVTAAHELLHAVYVRLPRTERQNIDNQLKAIAHALPEGRTKETIDQYRQTVPEHLAAERYAILGTEVAKLNPELERHYGQYFKNRQKIVGYSNQYEAVFRRLENEIKSYDRQLSRLAVQKRNTEADVSELRVSLQNSEANLRRLQRQDDATAYNRAVPAHNNLVTSYNQSVSQLKAVINQYNEIVERRNKSTITQNGLVKTLDSTYEPVQP